MRKLTSLLVAVGMTGFLLVLPAPAAAADCPPDSVRSGNLCIDKYEASVWEIAESNVVIKFIRAGRATLDMLLAAGAVQHGVSGADYGKNCPASGNGCVNFYAVSIPGVTPSANLTWFQAAAAARNSGKRLPTNAEWQVAALGTPDPGTNQSGIDDGAVDCNIGAVGYAVFTGSRSRCVSDVGAFDMVGNVWEWVADWTPRSTLCISALFAADGNCLAGASVSDGPGALLRGGGYVDETGAGVFAVSGLSPVTFWSPDYGFRAAR